MYIEKQRDTHKQIYTRKKTHAHKSTRTHNHAYEREKHIPTKKLDTHKQNHA